MTELISIVIPIFNAEQYLEGIIESIIKQTYKKIELILVDDGSTDESRRIIERYVEKYDFIKAKYQKNQGPAVARNSSRELIEGEYIAFLDVDDTIALDYIECLYTLLKYADADIAVCGYQKIFEGESREFVCKNNNKEEYVVYSGEDALEKLLYRKTFTTAPWGKLIKKELFLNYEFPAGRKYEDLGTVYKWFGASKRVVYTSQKKYFYLMRENSTQHSVFVIEKWDLIKISEEILEYLEINFPQLKQAGVNRMLISAIQLLRAIPASGYEKQNIELKKIIKKYRKVVLTDRNAKKTSRVLAMGTYIPLEILRKLGQMYDKIIYRYKIKMKY